MALIVAYCVWSIFVAIAVPDPEMAELTDLLGEGTGELVQSLTVIVYIVVIVATVIFQGLNARYYYVRTARIRDYVRDTPPWGSICNAPRSSTSSPFRPFARLMPVPL